MGAWEGRSRLEDMDVLQQIAAVAVAGGAVLVFALMAWAGQHQS
jgi:hypothetical protein